MRRKKGFTLIELLAVIVVLAIILVLSIPKILEIIENAEKQAYKESVELMAHTARLQYQTGEVTGGVSKIPEGGIVYTFEEGEFTSSDKLNFKGDKPYSGTITLTKDKKVIIDKLVSKNKKWCAIKEANEKQARVGRSTDPDFACVVEEDAPVVDVKECELAEGTEKINGEDKKAYYIDSVCDMYEFSYMVNKADGNKTFSGEVVKVRNDIDMSDIKDISDKLIKKYGTTDFSPIGSEGKPFSGIFDGGAKAIKNLTINKSNQNYVGLFGYVTGTSSKNKANIYGVRIVNDLNDDGTPKGTITGNHYVGGLIGYTYLYTTIKEIELDNIKITGASYVGSLIGSRRPDASNTMHNILVKTGNVNATSGYAGLMDGYYSTTFTNSIVENVKISASSIYTTEKSNNAYHSTNSFESYGFDPKGIDDINFYEAAGLDTWIGGDNDSSGYYFDYDSNNKVILKGTKKNPITFNLSKDDDENYLIKSEKDYKEASTRPKNNYKLVANLDFSTSKYYMLGSNQQFNQFSGILNGNDKIIKNVTINGNKVNYLGMIGSVNCGTIYGLVLKNIVINGYDNVGVFGYVTGSSNNKANIYGIRMVNDLDSDKNTKGTITGNHYVGGLIGYTYLYTTIKEIELDNIKITGASYVGSLIGSRRPDASNTMHNILVKIGNVNATSGYAGLIDGNYSTTFTNSIVENVKISASSVYTTEKSNNAYHSTNSFESYGFDPKGIDDINFYEAAGLDTWIGGDGVNGGSGYYFDYDENNKIILKSVKQNPITFTLKGSGTESDPYLIENEKHWKESSSKSTTQSYYKLANNLDFSTNKYYMLGSYNNKFSGKLMGNDKTISNVTINGNKVDYLGMIGYVNGGTIYGLVLKNIVINGYDNVGIFGYVTGPSSNNRSNIYGIRMINDLNSDGSSKGTITGNYYVGGLIGYTYLYTTTKEIELDNIKITGASYVGSLIGSRRSDASNTMHNILVKTGNVSATSGYAGLIDGNYSTTFTNSIVENVKISASSVYTTEKSNNAYHSTNSYSSNGFNPKGIDDINFYEAAGLDTWIAGDGGSGYYFDYDNNNKIILKSAKQNPIIFTLKGSGTESDPYLIENEKHWKEASSRSVSQIYYKLTNNLDFSTNKYYMLGSHNSPFSGKLIGNDKTISNVTINGNKVNYLGMIGSVNGGTIYGLVLKNIIINGYDNVGIFGYVTGPSSNNRSNIYGIRMINDLNSDGSSKGTITGNYYVGGLIGYTYIYTTLREIELDNMKIAGSSYIGSLIGARRPDASNTINNILVKTGNVSASSGYAGLIDGYYSTTFTNSIVENVKISASSVYKTENSNNTYHSNNVTINGTNVTDGFNSSLINNLEYYAGILETLYSGDTNNTGYFFDKGSDGQVRLVKAYSLTFTSPPSDDTEDTNTEGGGTEADTCYITISCSGSGKYRNCYINYYENGVSEAPYLNTMTLDLTRGSSCAVYSPNNSPGGFNFYVSKRPSVSGTCSVTFRARSNKDCITTTYKTISF